jgi:hypothetical protein
MATHHNFRIKNGLEVGGVLIVNSSGQLQATTIGGNLDFADNVRARFGDNNEFSIHHNANGNTYIGGGTVVHNSNTWRLMNMADTEAIIKGNADGNVELFYDGGSRLVTTTAGVQIPTSSTTIGWSNLANAWLLVGTSSDGIGIDNNEIMAKGGPLYLGTADSGANVIIRAGGTSARMTIAASDGEVTIPGDLSVGGDLNITGDINSVSITDLDVVDKTITLGKGQSESSSGNSGLLVDGPSTQPSLLWNESATTWALNYGINIAGNVLATNNVYSGGSAGFVFGSSTSEGEYISRSVNDIQFYSSGGHKFSIGTNTTLHSGNLLVPDNSLIEFGNNGHSIQAGASHSGGDMTLTSSDDMWFRTRWARFLDIAGSAGEYARIAHNGSWIYSNLITRNHTPQSDSTYYLGSSGNEWAGAYIDTGVFGSLDVSGNVDIDGTLETDGLTVNGNPVYLKDETGASVAGAGYYRVAANTVGGAGRGAFICTVYTTGGSYAPHEVVIQGHADWSTSQTIHTVKSSAGNGYFTKARIVRESGDAFLEVYFAAAITDLEIETVAVGQAGWYSLSGALTAATGTETSVGQVTLIAPGLNTQEVINSTQGFQVNNQSVIDNSRNIENITTITTEGTATSGTIMDIRPSDTNQMFRVRFPDSSTMEMGTTRAGNGNIQKAVVYGQAGVDITTNGVLRASMTQAGDFSLDADCGGLYFGGSTRSTSTNAQAYIKESGLNLDIKGNDNVRLLGDGGSVILHADYTGKVSIGSGVTAPASILHVKGTQSYGSIRVSPTSANGESAMAFFLDTAGTQTSNAWVVGHAGWGNTNDFVIGNQAFGGPVMLMQQNGQVGIGTLTPSSALDVRANLQGNGTAATSTAYFVNKTSGATSGSIYIGASTGIDWKIGKNVTGISNNVNFSIADSSGNRRFDIDGSGNVGIGTSSPNSYTNQTALTINGTTHSRVDLEVGGVLKGNIHVDSAALNVDAGANKVRFYAGNSERARISSTGRLHINHTNDPGWDNLGTLVVRQVADNIGIGIIDDASQNTFQLRNNGTFAEINYNVDLPIRFSQNEAESMTIDTGGNVGIGTTAPNDGKLQISANSSSDWGTYIYNINSSGLGLHVETNSYGTEQLLRLSSLTGSGGSNVVRMVVRADGKVGIGTASPADKLHISGGNILLDNALEIRTKDTGGNFRTIMRANSSNELEYGWSANAPVKFMGGGSYTERMRIHTNGNVGINDITPNATLDIANGNVAQVTLNVQPPGSGDAHVAQIQRGFGSHKGSGLQISGANYTNGTNANAAFLELAAGSYSGSNTKYIHAYDNSGTDFMVGGDGKVGIGTASPDATLHVDGAAIIGGNENKATTPIAGLHVIDDTYSQWHQILGPRAVALRVEAYWKGSNAHDRAIGDYAGGIAFNILGGHSTAHDDNMHGWIGPRVWDTPGRERAALVFATNNETSTQPSESTATILERMCITPAGLVGIANPNPGYLLEVGSASQTNSNVFSGRVNGDFIFNLSRANDNLFSIRNNGTGIVHLNTQNSAALGIGVSTSTGTGTLISDLLIDTTTVSVYNKMLRASASAGFKIGPTSGVYERYITTSYAPHNTANQMYKINLGNSGGLSGLLEITVQGTYSHQDISGYVKRSTNIGINANGSIWRNDLISIEQKGRAADQIVIGPVQWDSSASNYYVNLYKINGNGNAFTVGLKLTTGSGTDGGFSTWSINNHTTLAAPTGYTSRYDTNATPQNVERLRITNTTSEALRVDGNVHAAEFDLPSGGMLDWANGDARIIEGNGENYSLSLQTYDGSNVTTNTRFDGDNSAHHFGSEFSFLNNKIDMHSNSTPNGLSAAPTMRIGDFSRGTEELQFNVSSNGSARICFKDNNWSEGTYIKSNGDSYGGNIYFGAMWDDEEDKIVMQLRQSSAGASYDARMGINTTGPDYTLDVNGDVGINDYIYHNGDTNTYMQFNSADSWRVVTGGGERLLVNNGGISLSDNLALGGNQLENVGDAYFNEYLYHNGDNDTYFRFQADRIDVRAGGSDTITVKPTQLDINQSAKYSGFSTAGGENRDQAIYIGRDQTDTSTEYFTMGFKATARSGEQMHPTNGPYNGGNAFYMECGSTEAGGICLDQDSVQVYGSSDSGSTFRVIDKDSDIVTFEMKQTTWEGVFRGNVTAFGSMSSISDKRIKENIEPIEPVIEKIKNIGVYKYNKITAPKAYKDRKEIGVIAQEIQKEFPDLVNEETVDPEKTYGLDTILSVDYEHLTAVLLKGMQEQQDQIDSMKKQIEELTSKHNGE